VLCNILASIKQGGDSMVRFAAISIALVSFSLVSFVGTASADSVLERGAYLVTGS